MIAFSRHRNYKTSIAEKEEKEEKEKEKEESAVENEKIPEQTVD